MKWTLCERDSILAKSMVSHSVVSSKRVQGRRLPARIRDEIRNSTQSARSIAKRYGVNLKTVLRWRNRDTCEPRKPRRRRDQSALFVETLAVGLRRFAQLSLDDCVHVLRTISPGLGRASVHRCFRRHGISRLPESQHRSQVGWFDVHVFQLDQSSRAECLYAAIEQRSRFIFAEVRENTQSAAAGFLQALQKASPVTVLGVCVERGGHMTTTVQRDLAHACVGAAIRCKTISSSWPEAFDFGECRGIAFDVKSVESFLGYFNHRCRLKTIDGLTPTAYIERHQVGDIPDDTAGQGGSESISMRERILERARSLLSNVGPEGMSLAKVARLAGVNRGTIYHHFASRNELLAVAAEWSSEQLANAVFAAPFDDGEKHASQSNMLRVISRLANFAIRNPEMSQAWLMQIISMPDPSKDRFWREYYGRSLRFQRTPVPAQDLDPEVLAVITLAGTFLWPMWARAKSGGRANLQHYANRYIREFFRLMIHGTLQAQYVQDADAELQAMKP